VATSVVNRYYDPATGQFLSVDPDVAMTDQPYSFTGDNPLNWTDPLGLKLVGTGTSECNGQGDDTYCNGKTESGQSALGVIVSVPTLVFSVGIGTVTVTNTILLTNTNSTPAVTVGDDGNVTVNAGGASATFSTASHAVNAAMYSSGSINFSVSSDGGLSASRSASAEIGSSHATVNTTASFYVDGGPPPPDVYGEVGLVVIAGTAFEIWMEAKPFCAPFGPVGLVAC
jgi:uncharacterized protein RhaS with RHS repeats